MTDFRKWDKFDADAVEAEIEHNVRESAKNCVFICKTLVEHFQQSGSDCQRVTAVSACFTQHK